MKRFEFRLERVLAWKRQRERLAELRLQRASLEREAARSRVRSLREQLDQSTARFAGRAADLALRLAQSRHLAQAGELLRQAEEQLVRAEHTVKEANSVWSQAAREVEVLVRLRGRRWQDYLLQKSRAEQEQLDELGMRRWLTAARRARAEEEAR